jgi:hypothetical protein
MGLSGLGSGKSPTDSPFFAPDRGSWIVDHSPRELTPLHIDMAIHMFLLARPRGTRPQAP